jgi:chorismate mutase-like protein
MKHTPEEAAAILDECRRKIDEIDVRLAELINERAKVVEMIGQVKQSLDMRIYEPKREEMVMANVTSHNGGPLSNAALRRIYERIMDEMRTLQKDHMTGNKDS